MNESSASSPPEPGQTAPPFGTPPEPEVILEGQPHIAIDHYSPDPPVVEDPQIQVDSPIENINKAWEVAYSAKDKRDSAADSRMLAKDIREQEAAEQQKTRDGFDKLAENFPQIREHIGDSVYPPSSNYPVQLELRAERVDKEADRIETWASILYDHPVAQAYKETHPNIDFSAPLLDRVERQADSDLIGAEWATDKLDELSPNVYLFGFPHQAALDKLYDTSPNAVLTEAYGDPDKSETGKSKWAEWDQLTSDPGTTLGQLKDFYHEAFRTAYIEPKISSAHMIKSILEDVRSGRASQAASPAS
jgi:hypothetical protein